jgi:hypothetical protein
MAPALNAPSFAYEDMKVKLSSGGTSWYSNRNSKLSVPQSGLDSLNGNNKKTLNLRPRNSQQYNHSAIRHNPYNPLQTSFLITPIHHRIPAQLTGQCHF